MDVRTNVVPKLDVQTGAEWIRRFYKLPGNECGGVLHIVLDDGNIERQHILWCINEAIEQGNMEAVKLGAFLLALPYEDRELALHEAF